QAKRLTTVRVARRGKPRRRALERFVPRRLPKRPAADVTNERMDDSRHASHEFIVKGSDPSTCENASDLAFECVERDLKFCRRWQILRTAGSCIRAARGDDIAELVGGAGEADPGIRCRLHLRRALVCIARVAVLID